MVGFPSLANVIWDCRRVYFERAGEKATLAVPIARLTLPLARMHPYHLPHHLHVNNPSITFQKLAQVSISVGHVVRPVGVHCSVQSAHRDVKM